MSTSGGTSGGAGVIFAKQTLVTPFGDPGVYALTSTVPADGGWVDFGLISDDALLTVGAGADDSFQAALEASRTEGRITTYSDGGDVASVLIQSKVDLSKITVHAGTAQTDHLLDLQGPTAVSVAHVTAPGVVVAKGLTATDPITVQARTLALTGGADGDVLMKSGTAFAPAPLTQMLGGAAPVVTAVNVAAGEADITAIGGNTSADSTVSATAATGVRLNRTSADGMTTRQLDVNNGGVRVTCNNSDVLDVDENGVVSQVSFQAQGLMGVFGATPISQPAPIADAAGGVVIDAEARTALNALLAAVRQLGLIDT